MSKQQLLQRKGITDGFYIDLAYMGFDVDRGRWQVIAVGECEIDGRVVKFAGHDEAEAEAVFDAIVAFAEDRERNLR